MSYHVKGLRGLGCSCSGLGAEITFNAATVWSDWMTGRACGTTTADQQTTCAAAKRAVDKIRYALSQLGYFPDASMGLMWSSADMAAYKAWAADAGRPSNGMPLKADLVVMQEQLAAGVVPGPEKPVEYVEVGGELVPAETSGLSTKIDKKWLILAAGVGGLALLGGGAYVISKKRKRARGGATVPAYAGAKA